VYRRTLIIALSLCVTLGPPGLAQTGVRHVSLEEVLRLFAANSPALAAARADAARAALLVRAGTAGPNPVLGLTRESVGDGTRESGETYLTLSQPLRWPGAATARRRAASHAADRARARSRADSTDLAFDVKVSFVRAWLAERGAELLAHLAATVQQADAHARARFEAGDLSGFDRRRLALERVRYDRLAAAAEQDLREARRALSAAVLAPGDTTLLAPAGLPDATPVDGLGLASHLLQAQQADLALSLAEAGAERAARIPAPTLTAAWKWQRDGQDGLLLGVAAPLPLFDRRAAPSEAAAARADIEALRLEQVRRQLRDERRSARERLARATAQRNARDAREEDQRDLLEVALTSYAEGELDLFGLLSTVGAWRELGLLAVEIEAEYWLSRFALERVGSDDPTSTDPELTR
jgi:outer membrane protein, heavy metal efflux system